MSWCDMLEAIADFLPCHLDERFCDTIADALAPYLRTTHGLEEQLSSVGPCPIISDKEQQDTEERWRLERVSDLADAKEVVDVLLALKAGNCRLSSNTAGYLLRSFSSSVRKHIQAEHEAIRLIRKAAGNKDAHVALPEANGEAA
ncbi:hypothetical protein [Rhizobium sp. P28RR-XV]|uniref:hypothetical protein n=1 Tax=Rhizobium sp. P28RR-XV TaxID=2726737 RepID=UPI0014571593|nr:hypothetical protein [Rhizobium sp. P28RR-XV]NLR89406.1 hypothetical protein [Rhizobium sp. P28RR-XV]